jgi:histone H3/H4
MDLTIKRIPTQAVADRIMSLAVNVVDQALERDAKTLSETAESSLSSAKEQFRRDNGLLV